MASDGDTDEVFDEEELAEGFDEEVVVDVEELDADDVDDVDDVDIDEVEGDDVVDVDDGVVVAVAIPRMTTSSTTPTSNSRWTRCSPRPSVARRTPRTTTRALARSTRRSTQPKRSCPSRTTSSAATPVAS